MSEKNQDLANSITIVHCHVDFFIAVKPAGEDCHDNQGAQGFFNRLSQQQEESLYPVHRLDKVTSGLIIMARNANAAARFEQLFRLKQINKQYLAFAQGKPSKKQGWVKGDMQKSRRGMWKLTRTQENPAITQFSSYAIMQGVRGYLLSPKTGKTHQLRVAMKSLGVPILGDQLYGDKALMSTFDRTYLHAFRLYFQWENELVECQFAPDSGELFLTQECIDWVAGLNSN